MYYSQGTLCILFFIHFKFGHQAELCHQFPSKINPEMLCNGFTNLLRFNSLPDNDISKLSFSKNKITTINSSSFNDILSSLMEIYLDNNTITNITANAFKNLPNIKVVDLSNNKLEVLNPDIFSSNRELVTIDLAGNNIKVLPVNLINKLGKLENLILSKNPLEVCDPETAETLRYLEDKKIETQFLPTCSEDSTEHPETETNHKPEITKTTASKVDGVTSTVTESNDFLNKYLPLVVILSVMLLVAAGLGYAIGSLCIKLHKKANPEHIRTRTVSGNYPLLQNHQRISRISGEDENGYLIPKNIIYSPKYIEVVRDTNEAPLISLNSEPDLQKINQRVEMPLPHGQETTYQPNHVYEVIQERGSFYKRNLQHHMKQPYSSVKIVHTK